MLVAGIIRGARTPRNSPRTSHASSQKLAGADAMHGLEAVNDAVLTSLDLQETTVQQPWKPEPCGDENDDDDLGVNFRHSGWLADRERIKLALAACAVADSRMDRFTTCGSRAWVQRASDDPCKLRIRADYCHDRFCTPCAATRSRRIVARLRTWLANQPARFVTLTLAADDKPLSDRLDRLYSAFRRLRRGSWWRGRVAGGAAVTEVKWSVASAHWHPHLHMICRGKYLDQTELSREWHQASGDSYIVDVQLVKANDQVTEYVTKYLIKPGTRTVYREPDRLQEMIRALHGRRLLLTFGDCKIPDDPTDEEPIEWVNVGKLSDILRAAQRGVPEALAIVTLLGVIHACATTKRLNDTS
jgi:hypothetical protein